MRFALINNELVEAKTGSQGLCPGCNQPVIAKCGTKKVHHWSHRGNRICDDWWEPETEWHRTWKDNFPKEWQEVFLPDVKTGEKHIADTKTPYGLVIEFQHSHIDPNERLIREKFYKTMVWVVDVTRLKRDYPRFAKGRHNFHETEKRGIFKVSFPDECFPAAWLESSVPVIFDFSQANPSPEELEFRRPLYCLFPMRIGYDAIVAEISRKAFVQSVLNGEWLNRVKAFNSELNQMKRKHEEDMKRQRTAFYPRYWWASKTRYVRRRRF